MRVTACQDKLQPHLPTGLCSAVLPLLSPSLRFAHCWHPVLFFCFYRTVCFGFPHVLLFSNPHCLLLFSFLTNFHASLSLFSCVRQTDFALDNMAPIIWKEVLVFLFRSPSNYHEVVC